MSGTVVIIPAAGRGRRFGGELPKQYQELRGRAILWHTLRAFEACAAVDAIIVAIHPDDEERYAALVGDGFAKLRAPVHGGRERADSVAAALASLEDGDELVLVHDAVRPWVGTDLIERVLAAAALHGGAIPALPVTETVKVVEGGTVIDTPRRDRLYHAQTPQGFQRSLLERAFAAAEGSAATDEASLVERIGGVVHVVEGDMANVKITRTADLNATDANPAGETRVGSGYDVHALAAGRPLILGGVRIDHEVGLEGHSDADVLTHAVIDALLGAACLGDIGRLFPDTDPAYEGISSLRLLADVRDRLGQRGAVIVNIDAVVMAQAPKLAPHIPAMQAALSRALDIDARRISLKATTTERLGFVGRHEGMAAQAVALLRLDG